MSRYVALLRGINVGGKNLIKMTALKECFEKHGFREVATFIASGNVIFEAAARSKPAALVEEIEGILAATFAGYPASIVLRSARQMREIVDEAPAGFGGEPAKYRYDVVFLKDPVKSKTAIESVVTREGVDRVYAGPGVIYTSRLASRATQSRLNKIASLPIYKSMTIRNWNTTTRLQQLMEE
jgi:uncharacterized protein (DUF1697 family)